MKDWKVVRTESSGVEIIGRERQRQIDEEGFTEEHDRHHDDGELAAAAGSYANYNWSRTDSLRLWPWEASWFKPSDDPIRNLVKAGALIAAEIDRLQAIKMVDGDHDH